MKHLTGCLIVLILNTVCWADFGSAPSNSSQTPQHKHKNHAIEVTTASVASPPAPLPTEEGGPDAKRSGMGEATSAVIAPLKQAVDIVAPAPVRTVLDEVVLEANALSPLTPTLSPQEGRGREAPAGEGSNLPTLRAWAAGMLIRSSPLDVSFLGGVQVFRSVVSAAVGVWIKRPGDLWSVEIGAATPTEPAMSFHTEQASVDGTSFNSRVKSFYEVHVTANRDFPLTNQTWIVPDAQFGVSMKEISNEVDIVTPYSYSFGGTTYYYNGYASHGQDNYAFSPLFRLGFTLFPDHLISFRSDVAYIGYANTVTASRQTFNLGFSGVMFRELLQIRL